MEIEKKYLVKSLPDRLEQYDAVEIEQGYLCRKPAFRIRKWNDIYIFTYKGPAGGYGAAADNTAVKTEGVRVNDEVEREIPESAYLKLREKVEGHLVSKTRYMIPIAGYDFHPAELDVFHGRLEGLTVVEVEFPDVETATGFVPPDWFGKDVTGDKHYTNGHLSTLERWETK